MQNIYLTNIIANLDAINKVCAGKRKEVVYQEEVIAEDVECQWARLEAQIQAQQKRQEVADKNYAHSRGHASNTTKLLKTSITNNIGDLNLLLDRKTYRYDRTTKEFFQGVKNDHEELLDVANQTPAQYGAILDKLGLDEADAAEAEEAAEAAEAEEAEEAAEAAAAAEAEEAEDDE